MEQDHPPALGDLEVFLASGDMVCPWLPVVESVCLGDTIGIVCGQIRFVFQGNKVEIFFASPHRKEDNH